MFLLTGWVITSLSGGYIAAYLTDTEYDGHELVFACDLLSAFADTLTTNGGQEIDYDSLPFCNQTLRFNNVILHRLKNPYQCFTLLCG